MVINLDIIFNSTVLGFCFLLKVDNEVRDEKAWVSCTDKQMELGDLE